jgi:hypothetical protein
MFILELLGALFWVLIIAGLVALGVKGWEWYDDRLLDQRIGAWFSKQDYITVQIFPPMENLRSMSEMENFFINLASVFTKKSPKDMYIEGKFYENFTFEVHSRGGQVGFFLYLNRAYLPLVRSSLAAHYPGTGMLECPDPLGTWPREWTGQVGPYNQLYGTDLTLVASDVHPLKSWKFFQQGTLTPISDPVVTLISAMENIESTDYAIVQFVLRPFSPDADGRRKKWQEEIAKLKKEYAANTFVEMGEGGQIQVLTKQEQAIINACEVKAGSDNFKCKIKILLLSSKSAPIRNLGPIMSYFKQFGTDVQGIKPDPVSKSNASAEGTEVKFIGPKVATWIDEIYWKNEQEYRKKKIYKSVLGRSLSAGGEPKYIDVESLAAMFHFPSTSPVADKSLIGRVNNNYSDSNSVTITGRPPNNLPI